MKHIHTIVFALLMCSIPTLAQEPAIRVFGYFQSSFQYKPMDNYSDASHSFNMRQMNLFMNTQIDERFSALVNLEFLNGFSTEKGFGALNIEDAWVKYQYSPELMIKAGLLVPTFNNLSEIKNRTPLLPYIYRPLVYESTISNILDLGNYLPERAFVQIYGTASLGEAKIDYATYIGNSETSYRLKGTSGGFVSGTDTSRFKMFGGRLGVRYAGLKAGFSATYDRNNPGDPVGVGLPVQLRDIPRVRIGLDVSYSLSGFTLESELISVQENLNTSNQALLDNIVLLTTNPFTGISAYGNSLNKTFYYSNLTYDVNEEWYAYGNYSYMDDKYQTFYAQGIVGYAFGGGYRPTQSVIVKVERANYEVMNKDFFSFNQKYYTVAVSVMF